MAIAFAPGVFRSGLVVSSTNNIPTAYSTAAGSLVIIDLDIYQHAPYQHIMVINGASSVISITTATRDDAVPASNTSYKAYIPASGAAVFDATFLIDKVYIQSESGSAISSGTVYINVW